jgi:hypothetical protein
MGVAMNKRFYIFKQWAEENAYGIVELTEDEFKAVRKFLDTDYVIAGDWVGGRMLYDAYGFNTYDEAYEFLMENRNIL